MTTLVAILNKQAVALAADSAATFGNKIWTSSNKIFALSEVPPVGIMIYDNMGLMGVPWETLIGIYRTRLPKQGFNELYNYGADFARFINSNADIFKESPQKEMQRFSDRTISYFDDIKQKIDEREQEKEKGKKRLSDTEYSNLVSEVIEEHYKMWNEAKHAKGMSVEDEKVVAKKYRKGIIGVINDRFAAYTIRQKDRVKLKKICENLCIKFPEDKSSRSSEHSGIVIAGFGKHDVFPSLISFEFEGMINNKIKYKRDVAYKIGPSPAVVQPFAQTEMIQTFLLGMNDKMLNEIEKQFRNRIDQHTNVVIKKAGISNPTVKEHLLAELRDDCSRAVDYIRKGIIEHLKRNYKAEVWEIVEYLPKKEMAEMAESLVNLSCIRKKISRQEETAAGPIDVAVISKSDGFVWIQRKQYFSKELNPHITQ